MDIRDKHAETTPREKSERFAFGENWLRFLQTLDDDRICRAQRSLQEMLGVDSLVGKTFLDAGSGSGLFSLAARRLGAVVHSFDFDPQSVACTSHLRDLYSPNDQCWIVEQGSVLDLEYLHQLGRFDTVYCWGVLHHTGAMWKAIENVISAVSPGGTLFIAIYNDQGWASRMWLAVKQLYNKAPNALRPLVLLPCALRLWGPTMVRDLVLLNPFSTWRSYRNDRGMSPWHDIVDWVGGYPFEVASPDAVVDFCRSFKLGLRKLKACGAGRGCNEYVFVRNS